LQNRCCGTDQRAGRVRYEPDSYRMQIRLPVVETEL
jgi:hypothetical protein